MKYFWITLKHKWFILLAGRKTKVSLWRLILHDWTKFLPSELPHYNRQFCGPADQPGEFIECWLKHQNRNPHHWEYWIPRTGHNRCDPPFPDNEPIPMPEWAVREMVADWLAAGRAYEGRWPDMKSWTWLSRRSPDMRFHPGTKALLLRVLREIQCECLVFLPEPHAPFIPLEILTGEEQ